MITFRNEAPERDDYLVLFQTTSWNAKYAATSEELAEAIRRSWYLVAAYDGEQLVGFGRVVSDGVLYAMIYDMIVTPEYQRRGIGSEILMRLLARCRAASIRNIQLFCAKGKESFYERHGFKRRPDDAPGMQWALVIERTSE